MTRYTYQKFSLVIECALDQMLTNMPTSRRDEIQIYGRILKRNVKNNANKSDNEIYIVNSVLLYIRCVHIKKKS